MLNDWDIKHPDDLGKGEYIASNEHSEVVLCEDARGIMRKRNGIKWRLDGSGQSAVRFLFVDVEGLRVYVGKSEDGKTLIRITREDLQP